MKTEETHVTETRKSDHIELAFKSQVNQLDDRFYYEPVLSAHPQGALVPFSFLGKNMGAPIWISSMTGGTGKASIINKNLAQACAEFGFGMGLGSCRIILDDDTFFEDFNLRPIISHQFPFFANLGVAQIEHLLKAGKVDTIHRLVEKLHADGLIIHVNPMQEWLQPEGDRFEMSSLKIIERMLAVARYPIIVKEVGQGMGKESLRALFKLPLAAIDFGAHGGTNFAMLELLRSNTLFKETYEPFAMVGHTANEMVTFTNELVDEMGADMVCKQVIISGGVKNFLDGYYLTQRCKLPAVFGMASPFLKHAQGDVDDCLRFAAMQVEGLKLANAFLKIKAH